MIDKKIATPLTTHNPIGSVRCLSAFFNRIGQFSRRGIESKITHVQDFLATHRWVRMRIYQSGKYHGALRINNLRSIANERQYCRRTVNSQEQTIFNREGFANIGRGPIGVNPSINYYGIRS